MRTFTELTSDLWKSNRKLGTSKILRPLLSCRRI